MALYGFCGHRREFPVAFKRGDCTQTRQACVMRLASNPEDIPHVESGLLLMNGLVQNKQRTRYHNGHNI